MTFNVGNRVKMKPEMILSRRILAVDLEKRLNQEAEVTAVDDRNLTLQFDDGHTTKLPTTMVVLAE